MYKDLEKRRENAKKWNRENRERHNANRKKSDAALRLRDPAKWERRQKNAQLKYKFGITLEQYEAMLAEQEGRCAICRETRDLVVDHDHSTEALRQLLCRQCNSMLGFVNDDTAVLQRAILYLEGHASPRPEPFLREPSVSTQVLQ